jgi:hypothetical protein
MTGVFSNPLRRIDGNYGATEFSFIAYLPKFLVIFAALTLVVNAALPQLEMAVTGGYILFMPRQLTLLILSFGTILLLKGRFQSSPLLLLTVSLTGYFALEALFLHFYQGLSLPAIRSSLECFTFLIVAGAASLVPLQLKSRHILGHLLSITLVCLTISAAQFFTNSPVVRTDSNDQAFHVQSYQFLDQTRAFSLFANGLDAGVFYSFMGGVAVSFCLRRGKRGFGLVLLLLCAFGCYATYTRLAMVGFVVSAIAVFVLSHKGLARFSKLLPLFSLCCSVLIVVQALGTVGGAGRKDLANISSLDQRIFAWGVYGGKFLAGSPTDMLLGVGQGPFTPYSSPDRLENAAPIPVDNAYLLVLLGAGLIGLACMGASYWCFWMFLRKRATSSEDHLLKGIAGIFATVPFFCLINDLPTQTILLLLLAVSLRAENIGIPASEPSVPHEQSLKLA